jgi:hypothetical protein
LGAAAAFALNIVICRPVIKASSLNLDLFPASLAA